MTRRVGRLGEVPDQEERWPALNVPRYKGGASSGGGGSVAEAPPKWRNPNTGINTPFIAGLTAIQVLPRNLSRSYLLIQNKSTGNMWVSFSNSATVFSGVLIEAGGYYEPYLALPDSVSIIGAAANLAGVCVEGIRG